MKKLLRSAVIRDHKLSMAQGHLAEAVRFLKPSCSWDDVSHAKEAVKAAIRLLGIVESHKGHGN